MIRRLIPTAALVLVLAGCAAALPEGTTPDEARESRFDLVGLAIIVPFAILFVLCVVTTHLPWKRVRRRRRMPAVIRPPAAGTAKVHRGGWRHARALGRFRTDGVERSRFLRGGWIR